MRACKLTRLNRSTLHYQPKERDEAGLCGRLRELAGERPRFGYRRLHLLVCREGLHVNHKRIYRLYRQEGLSVRRRKRKRVARADRRPLPVPDGTNERWSMDFVHDCTAVGRRFRTLNIVDDFTREALAMVVDTSISGHRVARVLEQLVQQRGAPNAVVSDNGPEFTGRALDAWAYARGIQLRFIEPGKPVQNAFVESFNGKFRDECLNQHWFISLADARTTIEAWRRDYNQVRPHSSLENLTPAEFAARHENPLRLASKAA